MRVSGHWLRSTITTSLVISLTLPISVFAQQQDPAAQSQPMNSSAQTAPGADASQAGAAQTAGQQGTGESGATQAAPAKPILPVNDGTQPNATPQTETPDKTPKAPLGTAAAPYEKGIGVAASRPAGAVIAPAKQRAHAYYFDPGRSDRSCSGRRGNGRGSFQCESQLSPLDLGVGKIAQFVAVTGAYVCQQTYRSNTRCLSAFLVSMGQARALKSRRCAPTWPKPVCACVSSPSGMMSPA